MENQEVTTLITVAALGIMYNLFKLYKEKIRPKRIAIIEDSDADFMMFKFFFHLDNVIIDRYKTADNLPLKFAKSKPDCVISDYYLEGEITGAQIIHLCDKLDIPSTLITGYDGPIKGVDSTRIIIKSTDRSYFEGLQSWALQVM